MTDEQKNNEPFEESEQAGEPGSSGDGFADGDPVEPYDLHERVDPELTKPVDPAEVDPDSAAEQDAEPAAASAPEDEPEKKPKKKKSASERIEGWRDGAAVTGDALSKPGKLGWKFYVIMGIGAMIAAIVLAVTNTVYAEDANFWQKLGPGSLESLRVLLRAPIHLSIGLLAFALTAWAVGVRAGKGDIAAARIGMAVGLAIMALELQWGFPGQRLVVYLIAFALYFSTVWLSFRCPPRVAGTLIALHAGLFAAIAGLGWLIVWVGL